MSDNTEAGMHLHHDDRYGDELLLELAAWTAPRTWVTSELVTSTIGNTHWRDNLKALGPDTVGTTISGIATAVGAADGMRARVRAGATPFDFIELHYDATYGKWVSATQIVRMAAYSATLTSNVWTQATGQPVDARAWTALDTAGLKPQIRIISVLGQGTATGVLTSAEVRPSYSKAALNATAYTYVSGFTTAAGTAALPSATAQVRQADWIDIDGGYAVAAIFIPQYEVRVVGTATVSTVITDLTLGLRWVA